MGALNWEKYMKRLISVILLLGVIGSLPSYAADGKQEVSLWDRLRKKVELLTPKKKISTTTAVGGVRGSLADADDVYWKGDAEAQPIDEVELSTFEKAVSLVEAGDNDHAQAAFSDFVKKYPESTLREDAEAALAQLQPKK